jgi:pyruvate formate lyase activating enzyme
MAFYKITYNEKYRFATLHNYGCTFKCPICSYKLRSGANGIPGKAYTKPERFLAVAEMKEALESIEVDKVNFMGGEPSIALELPEMLEFVKKSLSARAFLGHTNGSGIPMKNLDGANVGLKAWDEKVHLEYTGKPKKYIFEKFARSFDSGMELKANVVYVPGLVDLDQVEAIAEWISSLSRDIPFHIMCYIPVPGQPYPRPTLKQMNVAVKACQKHLDNVNASRLSSSEAKTLSKRDDRFAIKVLVDTSSVA